MNDEVLIFLLKIGPDFCRLAIKTLLETKYRKLSSKQTYHDPWGGVKIFALDANEIASVLNFASNQLT